MYRVRPARFALLLILLLALWLRVIQLDLQPLWWDEGYSVFFAGRPLPALLERTAVDIHPPLYYVLLQAWSGLFSLSPESLRLLSVLFGLAALPLVYWTACRLFDHRIALVAVALLALSPFHIYYSQEVRMYGLVALLALASTSVQLYLLSQQLQSRHSRVLPLAWLGYVLLAAAALYTQYLAVFILIAQLAAVWYVLRASRPASTRRALWRPWLLAWFAVGVLYLPWVFYAGIKLYTYVTAKVGIELYSRLDPFTFLAQHLASFSVGHPILFNWLVWSTPLFVLLALLGLLVASRPALIYLGIPLLLGFLVNLVYPFHPARYERLLLLAAPFFLMLVARGLVILWDRQRAAALGSALLIAAVSALSLYDFYTVPRYPDEDYRPLVAEIQTLARAGDLVLAFYPWQIGYLKAYYHGPALDLYEVPAERWLDAPALLQSELVNLRSLHPRIWLLAYQKLGRLLEDRLTNEFVNDYEIADEWYGNTRLEYFVQAPDLTANAEPVAFAPDLVLTSYAGADSSAVAPGLALARLNWRAGSADYSYSLRLVDSGGLVVAQRDAPIPPGANSLRVALPLPANLAPGVYSLQLVAYRSPVAAPLPTPSGAPSLTLTPFHHPAPR